MPGAARTGSKLLLVTLLLGAVPQDPGYSTVSRHLRFLAGNDPSARKVAEDYFDSITLFRISTIRSMAAREPVKVRAAFEAYLPHTMWRGLLPGGTIGEARKRDKQVFGTDGKRSLASLGKGAAKLLKGNAQDQALGLRLLASAPAPDHEVLIPFLVSKDPVHVRRAVQAIGRADPDRAVKEALRILEDGHDDAALQMGSVLAELGSQDMTPELLRILKKVPNRLPTIATLLGRLGDPRGEEALIAGLPTAGELDLYRICDALSQIGGEKSIAAIRALRERSHTGKLRESSYIRLLVRLRDPKIAAELVAQGKWSRELHYLGDRTIAEALVKGVKDRTFKLRERKSAIELIGLFGTREHVPLLLEFLSDERFRESAAVGLSALGDPKTARPVADALRSVKFGNRHGRALLALPLEGVEEPILEILDDPKGHTGAVPAAVRVAGRVMTQALRKKLVELLGRSESRLDWSLDAARIVAPHLDPDDRKLLGANVQSTSRIVKAGSAAALAMAGDRKGLEHYVRAVRDGRLSYGGRTANLLFALDPEPDGIVEVVERELKELPRWFDGAEFLAHRGSEAGKDLLVTSLQSRSTVSRDRALEALVTLGHPSALEAHLRRYEDFKYEPDREKLLARRADEPALARLREMAWLRIVQGNQTPARVLAFAKDRTTVPLFRRTLRRDNIDNDPGSQSNTASAARALAALGVREMTGDFLRMLRSRAARKRALGIECLVTLGERKAVPALVRLLSDVEEVEPPYGAQRFRSPNHVIPEEPTGVRVRDLATRAIEKLSGQTFRGTPSERADAAKAWYEKNGD